MTDQECATAIARWSRDCRALLGVSQDAVGKALGVSQPTISRMFPGKIGVAVKRAPSR